MRQRWDRQEVIQLLTISGTLAGLSITGLTIFNNVGKKPLSATIADDLLAFAALSFLISTYLFFFSLRQQHEAAAHGLERAGDAFFLVALTVMVASGFVMVYTVW